MAENRTKFVFKSVRRRTKIVATMGPSSAKDLETIEALIYTGMNVARINMSHGTHDEHAKNISNIRLASKELGNREVAILIDLCGPKIRVGDLEKPLELKGKEHWFIGNRPRADKFIPTTYENLVKDCEIGARVLFDDGLLNGTVVGKDNQYLEIEIINGGLLKPHKGINLPDTNVSAPSFTEKDRKDLEFGLTQGIDYIALSFVRSKEDILQVKALLKEKNFDIPIIAKIEKPEAITKIEDIMNVTDAIMIARGDMGVEVGNHLVPGIQKKIISMCNERGIPVITATQMLESMMNNPTPTRAEASDVANAVWDGTDAVMLSGETAAGKYPLEAVAMMDKIILAAEETPKKHVAFEDRELKGTNDAFMYGAALIAENLCAKRLVTITHSGATSMTLSKFRPRTHVLGVTNVQKVARKMCLYWGISPFFIEGEDDDSSYLEYEIMQLIEEKLGLHTGDKIVVTRGEGPLFKSGESSSLRVITVKDHVKHP